MYARDGRGLLLRRIGAARGRREILLQLLHPCCAGTGLEPRVGQLLRQSVTLCPQRIAVRAGALCLRLQCRQLLCERIARRAGGRHVAVELRGRFVVEVAGGGRDPRGALHCADMGRSGTVPVHVLRKFSVR